MSDKVVDSVVESAMALKEIAIENAKTQLMNELSPKIIKLFDERLNESSKKILSEQEEDEVSSDGEEAEAEVDLDDLAKEIEQEEGSEGGEGGTVEDKVEELEQKVDSIEVKVDDVEGDVAELKGEEKPAEEGEEETEGDDSTEEEEEEEEKSDSAEGDDEEVEIEDDSAEELGESVDIDIKDNDVRINVDAADDNTFVDIVDDTAAPIESDDEYVDIEDDTDTASLDDDEIKENRRMTLRRKIRESGKATSSQLEHRVSVLKRALNRASKIIVNERAAMKKVENVLNETKLLNEKLVLVNRIFAKYDLNKDRKYRVLEAFDKASNSKESVIVYKTILEQLDKKGTVIKNSSTTPSKASKLQESMKKDVVEKKEDGKKVICEKVDPKVLMEAARPTGVLPPSKIVDADRMKKLAGIE